MKRLLYISFIFIMGCKTQKKMVNQEVETPIDTKSTNKIDDLHEFRTNVSREEDIIDSPKRKIFKKNNIDPTTVTDHTREVDSLVEQETDNRVSGEEKIACWQVLFKCGTHRNKKLAELATEWIYNNRDKFSEGELKLQRKFENGGYVIIIKEFTDELEAKIFQYKISRIPGKPRVYLSRRVVYLDIESYRQIISRDKEIYVEDQFKNEEKENS